MKLLIRLFVVLVMLGSSFAIQANETSSQGSESSQSTEEGSTKTSIDEEPEPDCE